MAQVHMTEAEVSSDFAAVLRRIGDGEEVVVDQNGRSVALIKRVDSEPTISDLIAGAERRERERGYSITLDPEFASDVEEIVRERKPWAPHSQE